MSATKPAAGRQVGAANKAITRIIVIHGDKGGVGKSMVAMAIADYVQGTGAPVAVMDADTQNPDVSRMFDGVIPVAQANLREENGWMDLTDFVTQHIGHTIILNTPAGIGEYMKAHLAEFAHYLKSLEVPAEMEMWWTMNVQHDSVNLLNEAYKNYGEHFARIRVVCNLHFANDNASEDGPFLLWFKSTLRTQLEKKGGITIPFPGLHIRVVAKLFAPGNRIPFSQAVDATLGEALDFTASERHKLQFWQVETKKLFDKAFAAPVAVPTV